VKLVVGLGNPGRQYASTRHNVGFRAAERFARAHAIPLDSVRFGGRFGRGRASRDDGDGIDVGVLLPQTYMNRSGEVVAEALRYAPVDDPTEDVIVVLDDVDLPFGRLRLRPSGRSAGHRGLANVIDHLGTDRFPRVRVGIGRPVTDIETTEYVLQSFSDSEDKQIDRILGDVVSALDGILFDGIVAAMNRFNRTDFASG